MRTNPWTRRARGALVAVGVLGLGLAVGAAPAGWEGDAICSAAVASRVVATARAAIRGRRERGRGIAGEP